MAFTMPATALFTLPPGTSHICPDATLSLSVLILPAACGTRYTRRRLATPRLQSLGRLQGSQGFELRSIGCSTTPFASTSSMPP
jgi:hypothetical protein